jgi:hypothetical protein
MADRLFRLFLVAAAVFGAVGCGSSSDDDVGSGGASALSDDSSSNGLSADAVDAAIAKLDKQRNGAPIGPFYADGTRMEGCWRNPAGDKLSDLQKSFYCSMPLEFRICNTVVLLTSNESDVDKRFQGYLDCQTKVDAVFGSKKLFVYDDDISTIYKELFLKRGALPDADTTRIVAAAKPTFGSSSFTVILAEILASLGKEAVELSAAGLEDMVTAYKNAEHDDPR